MVVPACCCRPVATDAAAAAVPRHGGSSVAAAVHCGKGWTLATANGFALEAGAAVAEGGGGGGAEPGGRVRRVCPGPTADVLAGLRTGCR
jgi:hypothetical protein